MKKCLSVSFCVILLLFSSACSNGSLAAVGKAELAVSTACSAAFQTVTMAAATNPPLIDQTTANNIVSVLLKIEQANQQAETATQAISTLSAANQANLLAIIQPIQTAIANAVTQGTVGIKDPTTQTSVVAALTAVQVAITAVVTTVQAVKTTN